jgi:hypothetical protein
VNPVLTSNGGETDVLTESAYKPGNSQNRDRARIWRFGNDDGRLLGILPGPKVGIGSSLSILARGDGNLWVGLGGSLYVVRPNALTAEEAWRSVTIPGEPSRDMIQQLAAGPDGGLWVLTANSAYLWKKPHE